MRRRIRKILIANRGEIAVRIMKTCREMEIKTVAVFSEIDRNALHVRLADEAHLLGNAPAAESYLNQQKIISVAKAAEVDAIHPGYGFLSENPEFAEITLRNHLIFIGPSAESIRLLGDKTAARRLAASLGIPVIPGSEKTLPSLLEANKICTRLGYPILLKAAAGGGGKGMRIVREERELPSALKASQSEAQSAFGDNRVYIEKYIENPRHIEVQVLVDSFGNAVHIGERECSIQRRHQKIVEESPSIVIEKETRDQMLQAATQLVLSSHYLNAATVEFLFSAEKKFYFMEVNTRLQVEHPVTEMRTGIDIVREQIRIADGEKISFSQEELRMDGHSIECRIYAEDPENRFFPSTGRIYSLRTPSGAGIRDDRGVQEGDEISSYYDPLIAKLIVWSKTRTEAIARMLEALKSYQIYGVRNNLRLCSWILNHPHFRAGEYNTKFLDTFFSPDKLSQPSDELKIAGAAIVVLQQDLTSHTLAFKDDRTRSKWKSGLLEGMH